MVVVIVVVVVALVENWTGLNRDIQSDTKVGGSVAPPVAGHLPTSPSTISRQYCIALHEFE